MQERKRQSKTSSFEPDNLKFFWNRLMWSADLWSANEGTIISLASNVNKSAVSISPVSLSRLKAIRGIKPLSSIKLTAVKNIIIGGSITAITDQNQWAKINTLKSPLPLKHITYTFSAICITALPLTFPCLGDAQK